MHFHMKYSNHYLSLFLKNIFHGTFKITKLPDYLEVKTGYPQVSLYSFYWQNLVMNQNLKLGVDVLGREILCGTPIMFSSCWLYFLPYDFFGFGFSVVFLNNYM